MDESKLPEKIKIWEHPPWYGSDQFKEKVTLIFLENQKGLFHHLTTRYRMPVKRLMISGPCQETSFSAITLNPESNFTRREKNHSLFHWNTLTSPELLIRIWMLCKRSALMIIGISMGLETCQILGQVSHKLLYWKKNLPTDLCGPGEINKKTAYIQARSSMARALDENWEEMLSWRRGKSGQTQNQFQYQLSVKVRTSKHGTIRRLTHVV